MSNWKGGLVAVVGGTGSLGSAIATRLAGAGVPVIVGSRSAQGAAPMAEKSGLGLTVRGNAEAAAAADLVIVTVPFSAQEATLREISPFVAGKIVVDTTVPLMPPRVMRVQLPAEGSAAVRARSLLGDDARLVSAFHNVAAHKLSLNEVIDCDVLVFGDDKVDRAQVAAIVRDCGLRPVDGGALVNSAAAEALTSVLIFINKTYAVDGAGVRITGHLVERAP